MSILFSKINKVVIGLLLFALILAPAQSLAISSLDPVAIERSRCISIYNSANYLEAATCFGNLFNNSLNTERFKDLNNKTVTLRGFNGVCIDKYNRGDFVGARDCFNSAVPLACFNSPVIDEYCGKLKDNAKTSSDKTTFNTSNIVLFNQQNNELRRCNGIYDQNDLNGAVDCYNGGIKNTCYVLNGTDNLLDELCGKFRNNANTAQRDITDCYNTYNSYGNYSDYNGNYYNNYKCSKVVNNTSDTVKIIAGAAVLACVFFCGRSSTDSNPGGSSTPGNYNNDYYYNSGGSSESGPRGGSGQTGY